MANDEQPESVACLTPKQVGELCGYSKYTILREIRRGNLKGAFRRPGGREYRIPVSVAERYVRKVRGPVQKCETAAQREARDEQAWDRATGRTRQGFKG